MQPNPIKNKQKNRKNYFSQLDQTNNHSITPGTIQSQQPNKSTTLPNNNINTNSMKNTNNNQINGIKKRYTQIQIEMNRSTQKSPKKYKYVFQQDLDNTTQYLTHHHMQSDVSGLRTHYSDDFGFDRPNKSLNFNTHQNSISNNNSSNKSFNTNNASNSRINNTNNTNKTTYTNTNTMEDSKTSSVKNIIPNTNNTNNQTSIKTNIKSPSTNKKIKQIHINSNKAKNSFDYIKIQQSQHQNNDSSIRNTNRYSNTFNDSPDNINTKTNNQTINHIYSNHRTDNPNDIVINVMDVPQPSNKSANNKNIKYFNSKPNNINIKNINANTNNSSNSNNRNTYNRPSIFNSKRKYNQSLLNNSRNQTFEHDQQISNKKNSNYLQQQTQNKIAEIRKYVRNHHQRISNDKSHNNSLYDFNTNNSRIQGSLVMTPPKKLRDKESVRPKYGQQVQQNYRTYDQDTRSLQLNNSPIIKSNTINTTGGGYDNSYTHQQYNKSNKYLPQNKSFIYPITHRNGNTDTEVKKFVNPYINKNMKNSEKRSEIEQDNKLLRTQIQILTNQNTRIKLQYQGLYKMYKQALKSSYQLQLVAKIQKQKIPKIKQQIKKISSQKQSQKIKQKQIQIQKLKNHIQQLIANNQQNSKQNQTIKIQNNNLINQIKKLKQKQSERQAERKKQRQIQRQKQMQRQRQKELLQKQLKKQKQKPKQADKQKQPSQYIYFKKNNKQIPQQLQNKFTKQIKIFHNAKVDQLSQISDNLLNKLSKMQLKCKQLERLVQYLLNQRKVKLDKLNGNESQLESFGNKSVKVNKNKIQPLIGDIGNTSNISHYLGENNKKTKNVPQQSKLVQKSTNTVDIMIKMTTQTSVAQQTGINYPNRTHINKSQYVAKNTSLIRPSFQIQKEKLYSHISQLQSKLVIQQHMHLMHIQQLQKSHKNQIEQIQNRFTKRMKQLGEININQLNQLQKKYKQQLKQIQNAQKININKVQDKYKTSLQELDKTSNQMNNSYSQKINQIQQKNQKKLNDLQMQNKKTLKIIQQMQLNYRTILQKIYQKMSKLKRYIENCNVTENFQTFERQFKSILQQKKHVIYTLLQTYDQMQRQQMQKQEQQQLQNQMNKKKVWQLQQQLNQQRKRKKQLIQKCIKLQNYIHKNINNGKNQADFIIQGVYDYQGYADDLQSIDQKQNIKKKQLSCICPLEGMIRGFNNEGIYNQNQGKQVLQWVKHVQKVMMACAEIADYVLLLKNDQKKINTDIKTQKQ